MCHDCEPSPWNWPTSSKLQLNPSSESPLSRSNFVVWPCNPVSTLSFGPHSVLGTVCAAASGGRSPPNARSSGNVKRSLRKETLAYRTFLWVFPIFPPVVDWNFRISNCVDWNFQFQPRPCAGCYSSSSWSSCPGGEGLPTGPASGTRLLSARCRSRCPAACGLRSSPGYRA